MLEKNQPEVNFSQSNGRLHVRFSYFVASTYFILATPTRIARNEAIISHCLMIRMMKFTQLSTHFSYLIEV
jgi:hypothetical protein